MKTPEVIIAGIDRIRRGVLGELPQPEIISLPQDASDTAIAAAIGWTQGVASRPDFPKPPEPKPFGDQQREAAMGNLTTVFDRAIQNRTDRAA